MKQRYWILGALLALCLVGGATLGLSKTHQTSSGQPFTSASGHRAEPGAGMQLLAPRSGAYTGAYIEFGEEEDSVTLDKIDAFSTLVGRRQAIVAFSNFWGRGHFPMAQVRVIANAGAVPLIFWNPWDKREKGVWGKFDLRGIAAGDWDTYIDAWAQEARAFGQPILVAWGLEMNGNWFPWSGTFYGGGEPLSATEPTRYKGPETFKRAYRHVVDRVRAAGASNVSWVFHTNNSSIPDVPWNRMAAYYPGSGYVDWLAMSAYGKQFPQQDWIDVEQSLIDPYRELAAVDAGKPVLVAEWGIGEFPKSGDKGAWIRDAFAAMEQQMPRLKGAVFWHERWQNSDLSYSNLRAGSSLPALNAYRDGVSRPFWLAEPEYGPHPPMLNNPSTASLLP